MAVATQEYYVSISLKGNEIKDVVVEVATSDPLTAGIAGKAGQIKSFNGNLYISDGSKFYMLSKEATVTAIDTRVGKLETTVGDDKAGLVKDIADIKALIGDGTGSESISARVTTLEGYVGKPKVGEASATGLFKSVADNAASISTNATNIANNVTAIGEVRGVANAADALSKDNKSRLDTVEPKVETAQEDIRALKTKVGTGDDTASASGSLYARVKQNVSDISGLATRMGTAETNITNLKNDKVDKDGDKVLSDNNYTTADKDKLAAIAAGAQVNVIESVELDGATQTITGKKVTLNLEKYAKKSEVGGAYVFQRSVANVAELEAITEKKVGWTYNVETEFQFTSASGEVRKYPAGTNVAWTGTQWDPLGGMMDLSVYALKTDVTNSLKGKQDNLSDTQLKAVNSGITTEKVATYDGYDAKITAAQNAANAAQETADNAVVANKSEPNDAGTPKCKITYDAKGLVTAGADLTVDDLPDAIPFSKTTGTLPYAQSPIMAAQYAITSAQANTAYPIATGMGQALVAQAIDGSGNVVFCATSIVGGTVTLTFSETFTGKVNVVGLKTAQA